MNFICGIQGGKQKRKHKNLLQVTGGNFFHSSSRELKPILLSYQTYRQKYLLRFLKQLLKLVEYMHEIISLYAHVCVHVHICICVYVCDCVGNIWRFASRKKKKKKSKPKHRILQTTSDKYIQIIFPSFEENRKTGCVVE